MTPAQRIAVARFRWQFQQARPEQLPPDGEWTIWLYQAGRGAGKTRTAAEWLAWEAASQPNTRWAIVAPTFADTRDTCVEGESGILGVLNRYGVVKVWNRSLGEIVLTNGSRIKLLSADEPERFRGQQFWGAWCDELGSFRYDDAWDQLQFGLRLGTHPRTVITTTPRPRPLIRKLLARKDGSVVLTRGTTFDNAANLAPTALAELLARYEGTRLGRQELYGELIETVEGALWRQDLLDTQRVSVAPQLTRTVVSVDPAVTDTGDETGIIVAGRDTHHNGYVLADVSMRGTPDQWANRVVQTFDEWEADAVVVEVNQGGQMVAQVLRTVRPTLPIIEVRASKGKHTRAEPISALYEQSRIHHVGSFPELEEQLCFPAGTLVETARGHVPIEEVTTNDLVMTRNGFAPLVWAGQTGWATSLTSVVHDYGCVVSTPCHQLWIPNQHQFVNAQNVSLTDNLAVRHSPANTAPLSHGEETGITASKAVTTATPKENCFTAPFGKPTTEKSRTGMSFTTLITTPPIINWATSFYSPLPNTSESMTREPSFDPCPQNSTKPSPKKCGRLANHDPSPAKSATPCSCQPGCAQSSVLTVATNDLTTAVPVYDLTVADGYLPEFYANGVLVHNCTWTPDDPKSPDRLDALVWAFTELIQHSGALTYLQAIARMCDCGYPNRQTATFCESCRKPLAA